MIHADIEIEDLVRNYPFSVRYMMQQGIKCIACGEPIWGTLAEAAREKGYGDQDIQRFVSEMNMLASEEGKGNDQTSPGISTGRLDL